MEGDLRGGWREGYFTDSGFNPTLLIYRINKKMAYYTFEIEIPKKNKIIPIKYKNENIINDKIFNKI